MKKLIFIFLLIVPLFGIKGYSQQLNEYAFPQDSVHGADTAFFALPEMFTTRQYEVLWQVVPTFRIDSLTGVYVLRETLVPKSKAQLLAEAIGVHANTADWTVVQGRSNAVTTKLLAVSQGFLKDTVNGVHERLMITNGVATGCVTFKVYAWWRPFPNPPGLNALNYTFASQTLTNTASLSWVLPWVLNNKYTVDWEFVCTRASGTAAGSFTLSESNNAAATTYYTTTSTVVMTNVASQTLKLSYTNYGKKDKITITGSGTESVSIIAYCRITPIYP